jgi:hypothetical protein
MRKFLCGLIALVVAVLPAHADLIINPYWASPGISFITSLPDDTNLSTYTFSAANIGAADATRIVVVTAHGSSGSGNALTSATIAGVSATIVGQVETLSHVRSVIISARVPTGTTGDIVLNFAGAYSRMVVGVYRIVNADFTADDVQSDGSQGTTTRSVTLNVPANGVVIAADASQTAVADSTWSGVTEDFDTSCEALDQCTGAHGGPFATNASKSVQVTHTGSTDSAMIAAVWSQP